MELDRELLSRFPFIRSLATSVGQLISVGIFFQLLMCAVLLAVYMTGLEKCDGFGTNFLLALRGLIVSIASAFNSCFLSERVTTTLDGVGGVFYGCGWYRLPVRRQKLLVVAIQRTQREFRMTGLGLVECSLRAFASVSDA